MYLGRREGERHCIEAQRRAFESPANAETFPQAARIAIFISCKISRNLFYVLSSSIPEMILYPTLFLHIWVHNKNMASSGMLQPGKNFLYTDSLLKFLGNETRQDPYLVTIFLGYILD